MIGARRETRHPFGAETLQLLTRWYQLRQMGACRPLIQVWNRLFVFDDLVDPWGSARSISIDQVREMVELAEQACGGGSQ